jgi:hypothetical protein
MENWGLTTFGQDNLLIDTSFNAATAHDLQRVAIVSAHEMTHQWKVDLFFNIFFLFSYVTYFYLNVKVWEPCNNAVVE